MKCIILIIAILSLQSSGKKPRKIPADLNDMGVANFFESDEILRVWRFPEGGAVFEELIEIQRNDTIWTVNRFTYLLDEFRKDAKLKSLRKKEKMKLSASEILAFVNNRLLHQDTDLTKHEDVMNSCLCDLYSAEYRNGNYAHFFEFNLQETGNTNVSKIKLISFLEKIIE